MEQFWHLENVTVSRKRLELAAASLHRYDCG